MLSTSINSNSTITTNVVTWVPVLKLQEVGAGKLQDYSTTLIGDDNYKSISNQQ